jgi:hypothetical protein
MSAQGTYQFVDKNWLTAGAASGGGPGMNAANLLAMGWLNRPNQRTYDHDGPDQTFKLRALSRPHGDDPLIVIVNTGNPDTLRAVFTVEYRQGDGWDKGFSTDPSSPAKVSAAGGVVLVHRYSALTASVSTLINGPFSGAMEPCDTLVLDNGARFIHVNSLDTADGSASVTIGTGRGKFFPCFKNILTLAVETRASDHHLGESTTVHDPNGAPPILNPTVPPNTPAPPKGPPPPIEQPH